MSKRKVERRKKIKFVSLFNSFSLFSFRPKKEKRKMKIFFQLIQFPAFIFVPLWQFSLNVKERKSFFFSWNLIYVTIFFLFVCNSTGDSIFTAGKPAILANNTLIRGSKALNNRRPITSSSSTISSQSTNNDTVRGGGGNEKERKDKTIKDMQQRYMMDSGN